jgi:predicted ArsR family transcriptional regulator
MTKMRIGPYSFAGLIKLLMADGHTLKELAEETGLHYVTVRDWMTEFKRQKIVYVSAWVEDAAGRRGVRQYRFGEQPDKTRPRRQSGAERQRTYKARRALRQMPNIVTDRHATDR